MSCIPINDFSLITLCDATKAGKLYSIVPDSGAGDFDVVRASTATYLGSDGLIKTAANNEPRIEFNADGTYKGLLVEPAATNLALRSEEFDNASWVKAGAVTINANTTQAPDGTMTADTAENLGGSGNSILQSFTLSVTTGSSVTISVFVKNQQRIIQFGGATAAGTDVYTQQDVGNGYFRQIVTRTFSVTNASASVQFILGGSAFPQDDYVIWGAQLETGTVATSYIPTVASTVTRAADVISKTGASSILPTAYPFTLFAEFEAISLNDEHALSFIDISSSTRYFTIGISPLGKYRVVARDSAQSVLESISNATTGFHKICGVFTSSELKLFVDGQLLGSDTNTITFNASVDDLLIGQLRSVSDIGKRNSIKQAAILPIEITDEQAIQLTS